ncbi:zinc finger CCCH domain containing protein [Rhypophila sp. PSN 637]
MGDTTHQPGAPTEFPQPDVPAAPLSVSSTTGQSRPLVMSSSSGSLPFPPSHTLPSQYGSPQHGYTPQLPMAQPQSPSRTSPFNMSPMANALPQYGYVPGPYGQRGAAQRYQPLPGMTSPLAPAQFSGQNTMNMMPNQQYYAPQHAQMSHYYAGNFVVGQQPHPSAPPYYHQQVAHYTAQPAHTQAPLVSSQYIPPVIHQPDARSSPSRTTGQVANAGFSAEPDQVSGEGRPGIVRGPPRKPRQSGHAIWIGNLPPQTDLMSLVHHVCKEAVGLESLFLISKSNCAFANFKDEEACVAAQRKLHDSKFHSVRLVSRLRKSTVKGATGVTAPTGPAASSAPTGVGQESEAAWEGGEGEETTGVTAPAGPAASLAPSGVGQKSEPAWGVGEGEETTGAPTAEEANTTGSHSPADGGSGPKDRFFVLKSLTVEDLELSVGTGIWATQSHNEETLNSAFASSDNVYLVFSANKSGEYFGYARMTSPINHDPAAAIQFAPTAPTSSEVELPKAIPTAATQFAPKGRIIDDSARGTIFWEVERDDRGGSTSEDDGPTGGDTGSAKSGDEGTGAEIKTWGKPFRLEWLSTVRLPFYRTRGLRNPWNSNREVKIARDGTELHPAVGRRLIGLFNQSLGPASNHAHVAGGFGGVAIPIQGPVMPAVTAVGFPPMQLGP